MLTFAIILIIIVSVLLVLVILAQNSKGGGLATASGASQMIGAQRSSDWIEKSTWGLFIALFSLSLLVNVLIDRNNPGDSTLPNNPEVLESTDLMPMPEAGLEPTSDQTTPSEESEKGQVNEDVFEDKTDENTQE